MNDVKGREKVLSMAEGVSAELTLHEYSHL